jgi:AhpD family alkylhydroperoxidase
LSYTVASHEAAHLRRLSDAIRLNGKSRGREKTHLLDPKTRELIALAVVVTVQCDGCVVVHAGAALKNGATPALHPPRRQLAHPGSPARTPAASIGATRRP